MKKFNKEKFVTSLKTNRKKIIVLVCLLCLLVATGCLNYFLSARKNAQTDEPAVSQDANLTFFESYRADRTNTRAQEMLYLEDVIASSTSDEATRTSAQQKKLSLVDTMETELCLEGLIKAKGFEDCIVTITNNNVNVVVQSQDLTLADSAMILSIIVDETGYSANNVIVIPYI